MASDKWLVAREGQLPPDRSQQTLQLFNVLSYSSCTIVIVVAEILGEEELSLQFG